MKQCVNCGSPIDDDVTVCPECKAEQSVNGNSSVWARPGAESNSANTYVAPKAAAEPVAMNEPTPIVATAESNALNDDSGSETAAHGDAAEANIKRPVSEMEMRSRQAQYFGSVANVEEAVDDEIPTEDHSMLEVPFNDTEENLGFVIPKFRVSFSDSAKRRVKIGSAVTCSLAVLIAAVIILNGFFDFIPKSVEVPVLYNKGGVIMMTSSSGAVPYNINYSDRAASLVSSTNAVPRLKYTSDFSKMLVIEEYDTSQNIYTLYVRDTFSKAWRSAGTNGTKIDEGIFGDYKFFNHEKSIIYLKSSGIRQLYIYTFGGESVKLAASVKDFRVLSDTKIIYIGKSNALVMLDYQKDGTFVSTELDKSVTSLIAPEDYEVSGIDSFFYTKSKTNALSGEKSAALFYYNSASAEAKEIAGNVTEVLVPDFATGAAYYLTQDVKLIKISDVIEDDMAESDASVGELTIDSSVSVIDAYRRQTLRKSGLFDQVIDVDVSVLNYYNGSESSVITDNYESLNAVVSTNASGHIGLVYAKNNLAVEPVKLSSMPSIMLTQTNFYQYLDDMFKNIKAVSGYSAVIGTNVTDLSCTYMKSAVFSDALDKLYYVDAEDKKSGGALKVASVSGGAVSDSVETLCTGIVQHSLAGDTSIAVDSNGAAFAGNEQIADKVYKFDITDDGKTTVLLADYSESNGRLIVYTAAGKSLIADRVSGFDLNGKSLAYIGDYNTIERKGSLYVCNNFSSSRRIDDQVSAVLDY